MKEIEGFLLHNREHLKIHEYAFLESQHLVFSREVRDLCEKNACGMYGKSWACPPAVGSIEHCIDHCSAFQSAFVFTSLGQLRKKHDVNGWHEARTVHEAITEEVVKLFRARFASILALSTEGCMVCRSCSYPSQPCRIPERMFPAIEGFGINVMQMAKTVGIRYYNGPNTVTYFSLILFPLAPQ